MKTLVISAGGKNSRIRKFLDECHDGMPKHTLSLPTIGGCNVLSIIDWIVIEAEKFFDHIIVEASADNIAFLSPFFYKYLKTEVVVDGICSGPLGPPIRQLLAENQRVYACAGDWFHPQFTWESFEQFHDSHRQPISILVSQSVPMPKGATFNLEPSGSISGWNRVEHSRQDDLINIGCYIIDPDPRVTEAVKKMTIHKEDNFFQAFIPQGMIQGFNPSGVGFNINTADTYFEMRSLGPY